MKFGKRGDQTPKDYGQSFDLKNTFVIKAGKKINQYDEIQANSEDTDIYKTLEKYGSLEIITKTDEGMYGEFENIDQLGLHERLKKADEMWQGLPLDVRIHFKNDKLNFLQNGEKWLKERIEAKKPKPTEKTEKTEQKEVINEQK